MTLIVEKGERRESTEAFMSNDELYSFVIRKLAGTNYRFDLSNPRTDAMLPDGYRMNVKGGPTGWTVKDGQAQVVFYTGSPSFAVSSTLDQLQAPASK